MNHRVNTIACALILSALVVPASQAGDQRSPAIRHTVASSSVFTNLGHEGSGLLNARKVARTSVFTNLGHEGSGLLGAREVRVDLGAFTNLGSEGCGIQTMCFQLRQRPWAK